MDFDPQILPLEFLLDLYYEAIDPVSLNRQGADEGVRLPMSSGLL